MTARATFSNGRVFDGVSADLRDGLNVFVEDGRIREVSARPPNDGDGAVVDCGGRTLMPGLIDAHVHAYAFSVSFYEMRTAPDTLAASWASGMLARMLDRGFTTVRDTAGADYGLALALERGYIRGPRLFYCGRAISQTGGHGDFRNPHHRIEDDGCSCGSTHLNAIVVDGVPAVRAAVRENIRRGARFIKFMGAGGIGSTGDGLHGIQFADDEVLAIVDEVERHGLYCTAHVHSDRALARLIRLGVHCIEHGTLIERETAQLAAERGTAIVPTMVIIAALAEEGAELGLAPQSQQKLALVKDEAVARLQHLRDAGVRVGFGTDLLGVLDRHQLREFTLRRAVFTPLEILQQATSVNAQILGAGGTLGVIAPGAFADLLLIDGDPLADLDVLVRQSPAAIVQNGRFVKSLAPA